MNWSDGYQYCISGTTIPSSFKTSITQTGAGAYSNLIDGNYYVPSNSNYLGPVWNSKPSGNFLMVSVYFCNSSAFTEGNRVRYEGGSVITYKYINGTPSNIYDYNTSTLQYSDLRYFCSKSGNTGRVELSPNTDGTITLPFSCSYFFVVQTVSTTPAASTYWYPTMMGSLYSYFPDSTDTVTAIENQTEEIVSTEGSDSVAGDGQVGPQVEQIEGLGIWESLAGIEEQLSEAISTQDVDGTVVFPGLNLMGFTMPQYSVDVLAMLPIPVDTLRGFVTFVFVVWYIRYMYALVQDIFGLRWAGVEQPLYDVASPTLNGTGNYGLQGSGGYSGTYHKRGNADRWGLVE